MAGFSSAIKEIKRTLTIIFFIESLINSLVIFLTLYLALSLINFYPRFALMPSIAYFIFQIIKRLRKNKLRLVESKYSPLNEKLRTAADNIYKINPIVEQLQSEVLQDLKNVGVAEFLHTKSVSYKVLFSILISFVIVTSATYNIYLFDFKTFFGSIPDYITQNPIRRGENSFVEVNKTDDIYGDSSLAILGNKELDIKIMPVSFEVSIKDEGDIEKKKFDEIFPKDVEVKSATAFEENVPQEQQELVKSYFKKLAGS